MVLPAILLNHLCTESCIFLGVGGILDWFVVFCCARSQLFCSTGPGFLWCFVVFQSAWPLTLSYSLQERLDSINNTLTDTTFTNISRGIFHHHRLPFAFLLSASISQHDTDSSNFHTLLHIAMSINNNTTTLCSETPASGETKPSQPLSRSASSSEQLPGLHPSCWAALCKLAADVPAFEKLPESVENNLTAWIAYASEEGNHRSPMWRRTPPHFLISTDPSGEGTLTRALSLSERALVALCWKPDNLRAIMQVCTHPVR